MKEQRNTEGRSGLLFDILSIGQDLTQLAGSYIVLIREEVREEAKALGRRTALAAALMLMFVIGTILFAIGLSRIIDFWLNTDGVGFVVVGGFLLLLLPAAVLIMTRKGH